MVTRLVPVLVSVLACGCFAEADPLGDADEGMADDTSSSSTEQEGSASETNSSAGSASGTSGPTSASTTTTTASSTSADTGSSSESGAPACGHLGEPCCADEACDEGACHLDRCVAFAGAYAEPQTCGGCTDAASGPMEEIPAPRLPFLGACECPPGFTASAALPTTSDYCPEDGLLHTPTTLRVCEAPQLVPGADWLGAYATSFSRTCAGEEGGPCIVRNPYTQECDCPAGATEVVVDTWAPCGQAGLDEPIAIHVCVATDVPSTSFGGAYQTRWISDAPPMCEAGNPLAGNDCGCPAGFIGEPLRITSPVVDNGGDIFFCVGY